MPLRSLNPRRSWTVTNGHGTNLPPLTVARDDSNRRVPVVEEVARTSNHLRVVARYGHTGKPHKSPRAIQLEPLPFRTQTLGNNHIEERGDDDGLKAIWRVATIVAKQHSDNILTILPSTNHPHESLRPYGAAEKHQRTPEEPDASTGTTLARYRRLIGMHARKTLVGIVAESARQVVQRRRQDRAASRLQSLVRRFLGFRRRARRRYDQVVAAEKLQRAWRTVIARRELELRRQQAVRECIRKQAVEQVQQWYRIHRARQTKALEMASRQVLQRNIHAWWQRKKANTPTWRLKGFDMLSTGVDPCAGTPQNPSSCFDFSQIDNHKSVDVPDRDLLTFPHENQRSTSVKMFMSDCSWSPGAVLSEIEGPMTSTFINTHLESALDHVVRPPHLLERPSSHDESVLTSAVHLVQETSLLQHEMVTLPSPVQSFGEAVESRTVERHALDGWSSSDPAEMTPTLSVDVPKPIENVSYPDRLALLVRTRAIRILDRFTVHHCLPLLQERISTRHTAALRIQRLYRARRAHQHLTFHRQLHIRSLENAMQARWKELELQFIGEIVGPHTSDDSDNAILHQDVEIETDDDEPAFSEDFEEQTASDLSWNEVLPTRNGRFPVGLGMDLTRGGPTSSRAPSLGLWTWSWTTEQWHCRRDLCQFREHQEQSLD